MAKIENKTNEQIVKQNFCLIKKSLGKAGGQPIGESESDRYVRKFKGLAGFAGIPFYFSMNRRSRPELQSRAEQKNLSNIPISHILFVNFYSKSTLNAQAQACRGQRVINPKTTFLYNSFSTFSYN